MSKRNTLAGKKARRDNRIARLNQTGMYHPISGMQLAAPRSSKPNKYKPRRNTPKGEFPRVLRVDRSIAPEKRTVLNQRRTVLERGLGHVPRRRKGQR